MGVSASQQLSPGRKLTALRESTVPSLAAPISLWSSEPSVILANNSDYVVSYWAIEEDRKRSKAQLDRIVSSISLQLNASKITGWRNLCEDHKKRLKAKEVLAKKAEEEDDDVVCYLTRDHRMGRKGSTQPTHVPFPAGCQHVRLYGFFERDGEWQPYQDKVYSIAVLNRNFRVTASTANVTPYIGFDKNGAWTTTAGHNSDVNNK